MATNSDSDISRRAFLLEQLGPGATERVIDPGKSVVVARLSDSITGQIGESCSGRNRQMVWTLNYEKNY